MLLTSKKQALRLEREKMEFKINEVKDWIVVPVYSDADDPATPYRVIATNEEIKEVLKSFATPLIEDFDYEIEQEDEEYDEDFAYYYVGFSNMHVEVTATVFNTLPITTVENFVGEGNK